MHVEITFNALPGLLAALPEQIAAGQTESAQTALAAANGEVPVRTGNLRDSGAVVAVAQAIVALVYTAAYAVFVHQGTGRQGANPWLMRAIDLTRSHWQTRMGHCVAEAARAAGAR